MRVLHGFVIYDMTHLREYMCAMCGEEVGKKEGGKRVQAGRKIKK